MTAPAILIAAPGSGEGKTTTTLALLAAYRARGAAVRAAKSGPDYIDGAFHAAATGAPCFNLDSWSMSRGALAATLDLAADGAELLVIEGAMGLFDGVDGEAGRTGAAAEIAAAFGLPVILVLDVSGQAQSAAAVARGFAAHDAAVTVAGVILNNVASPRHRDSVAGAVEAAGLRVVGAIPREAAISLPERHLGLVQAREQSSLPDLFTRLAALAESSLDLDRIRALAHRPAAIDRSDRPPLSPPGQRIALAQDDAFSFVYDHLIAGWRRSGAEIIPFSPLADAAPDPSCDCCWLPGGYPELHAGQLAAASRFLAGLRAFAADRPVHGECGGYMVLGAGLTDADGRRHAMAGLLGHSTSFAQRRLHLGYRKARLLADCPIGPAGAVVRGHEFHYATIEDERADAPLVDLTDGGGRQVGAAGGRRDRVSGTFFHAVAADDDTPSTPVDPGRATANAV